MRAAVSELQHAQASAAAAKIQKRVASKIQKRVAFADSAFVPSQRPRSPPRDIERRRVGFGGDERHRVAIAAALEAARAARAEHQGMKGRTGARSAQKVLYLSICLYIYVFIYIYVCVYIYIYIGMYI